jgi:hypothetical protein
MRLAHFVPVAILALAGCATPVGGPADADPAPVHAFLRVDQAVDATGGARTHATASFLRVHEGGDPAVVARVVGAVPAMPPEGGCSRLDDEPAVPLHTLTRVELVQVEGVTVGGDDTATSLSARAYPDVAHLVSGVVYTSPDTAGAAGRRVTFRVAGSVDVPSFDVAVDTPAPLEGLRVNGVALGSSTAPAAVAPLRVTWDGDRGTDAIYADFVSTGTSARWRCTADALGLVGPALAAPAGTRINVTVHRVRVAPFAAGALGTAEVRLDAAIAGTLSFDEPG